MSSPNLINQAEKKSEEILTSLQKYDFETSLPVKKDYNFEFEVKRGKEKVKVLVYFGKKGVKVLLQGNNKSLLYKEVEEIATGNFALNFPEKEEDEPSKYIGSDETGKGDFFGPLVVCAVYVNEPLIIELKKLGVKDSKELSTTKIKEIAANLKKIGKDFYEIIAINPKKYNELYGKWNNINELLNWSHAKAIENLSARFDAGSVITDKFRLKEIRFSNSFDTSKFNLIQIPKAEKYTAVAAASILARAKQLEWFEVQKKNGLKLPRGASDLVKTAARDIIEKYGFEELQNYVKMHFKTVKNL